jgi:hypothetical protein
VTGPLKMVVGGRELPEDARHAGRSTPWPHPLAEEAYHGLLGDIVRAIEPYSEADPAAVLGHAACGIGAMVGPQVRALAGDAEHPARLNALVVGETSKGRKGSAARAALRLLGKADETFAPARVMEGLSSGEGVIHAVRDPIHRRERDGKGGGYADVLADPGVTDKRALIIEEEFAGTLRVAQRDGNTLTAVVRRAWDRGDLQTLTKNTPAVATGAHVTIVGHVARDNALRYLDRDELASGFVNRFLIFAAKRSKALPDGEGLPEPILASLAKHLVDVRLWARDPRVLRRDDAATEAWREVYPALSDGRPGLLGAATNRAEAQVLRLSVLYAILDRSEAIRGEHLAAALAVWRYCEESARWVFGDATGDPIADRILGELRAGASLDREAISVALFHKNVKSDRLDRALDLLRDHGLARCEREPTDGRPREVWRAR